jgi:hypothetical protein
MVVLLGLIAWWLLFSVAVGGDPDAERERQACLERNIDHALGGTPAEDCG